MGITFIDYTLETRLSTAEIDRTFRDKIRKPANAVLKLARLNWRFVSPDEDVKLFSPIGPVGEMSLAIGACFSLKKISTVAAIAQEALGRSSGGLILLGVKDLQSSRSVHIGHADNTGAKSCVRNFTSSLAAVDPSIHVIEGKRQLAG